MKLTNKTVLITGATSGIGEACAEAFAALGANLLLCARRSDLLNALSEKLKSEYQVDVHDVVMDVRYHQSVQKQLSGLINNANTVDVLINNAGLAAGLDAIPDADVQDWEDMINTNVKGLLYVTKIILPNMIAKQSGHIINIGSIAGHAVYPKGAVYCATKHAVKALTEGLRMDLLGTPIRISLVDPGAVETNFSNVRFKGDTKQAAKVYEGFTPLSAADIADAVVYCATRPLHVNIANMIIMPTAQAAVTMIARE